MAPLYISLAHGQRRAVAATLSLPAVAANASWYANWIMIVGEPTGTPHQIFVQIGLVRRPDINKRLHVFIASQDVHQQHLVYRQLAAVSNSTHRFVIAQNGDVFTLLADGREVQRIQMPTLANATRAYAQIGPEVFAQGDALSGNVLYAATYAHHEWHPVDTQDVCRYENHGVSLHYVDGIWMARGWFNRRLPSTFQGNCGAV
ncbi:MAG: hypothetical protein ACYDA5_06720 [Vulcanimicrobiaceae bacterium]